MIEPCCRCPVTMSPFAPRDAASSAFRIKGTIRAAAASSASLTLAALSDAGVPLGQAASGRGVLDGNHRHHAIEQGAEQGCLVRAAIIENAQHFLAVLPAPKTCQVEDYVSRACRLSMWCREGRFVNS